MDKLHRYKPSANGCKWLVNMHSAITLDQRRCGVMAVKSTQHNFPVHLRAKLLDNAPLTGVMRTDAFAAYAEDTRPKLDQLRSQGQSQFSHLKFEDQ